MDAFFVAGVAAGVPGEKTLARHPGAQAHDRIHQAVRRRGYGGPASPHVLSAPALDRRRLLDPRWARGSDRRRPLHRSSLYLRPPPRVRARLGGQAVRDSHARHYTVADRRGWRGGTPARATPPRDRRWLW